ncbi:MAG: stage II sporulation protein R [Peptococcaceae bacterium]|nr:stage II sporulation protein R [Peptococcaceae bacterium]
MKKRWIGIAAAVLAVVLLNGAMVLHWAQQTVEAYNPNNLIRLHVVANSDSEADQVLKLKVRDAIIETMSSRLEDVSNREEARKVVRDSLDDIQKVSAQTVAAAGNDCPVHVYYGHFDFPEKSYGFLVTPAGNYEAVRVVIGEGSGHNWWCVLFPPLCFVKADKAEHEQGRVNPNVTNIEMKFKVVELWHRSTEIMENIASKFSN